MSVSKCTYVSPCLALQHRLGWSGRGSPMPPSAGTEQKKIGDPNGWNILLYLGYSLLCGWQTGGVCISWNLPHPHLLLCEDHRLGSR